MININSLSSKVSLTRHYHQEDFGNFMSRPVKWLRQKDNYETLRKIFAIAVAIILSCTILGLFIVVPGMTEWKRQVNKGTKIFADIKKKGKKFFAPTSSLINPISTSLTQFDNLSVKGQVNGLYITTNETNLAATDKFLKTHPLRDHTIHIGCATWYNLDIMCKRKSNYGLIIDFNPENAKFIKKTIEIIKASTSREVFKCAMIAYLNSLQGNERSLFFHSDQQGLLTDRIEQELYREGSWLQKEESYTFIKSLVSKQQIIAITENITNHKKFSKLREFLDLNHIVIDTVYLSNICNFMQTKKEKEAFSKSITSIVDNNTIFISCPKIKQMNSSQTKILHQHSILGSEILEKEFCHLLFFELIQR